MKGMFSVMVMLFTLGQHVAVANSVTTASFRVEYEHRWSSDRITVQYPVSMVPTSLLGSSVIDPASTPTLQPAAPCQWRWVSDRELGCQLPDPDWLRPATAYSLSIPSRTSATGQVFAAAVHPFETRRPALSNGGVQWSSARAGTLTMRFTAAVDYDSLKANLYLRDQQTGERKSLLDVKADAATEAGEGFVANLPSDLRVGAAYALGFADGIKPLLGELPVVAHERSNTVLVPDRFDFVGISCVPAGSYQSQFTGVERKPRCKPDDGIDLWFTEQPSSESIELLQQQFSAKRQHVFSARRELAEQNGQQVVFSVRLIGLPSDQSFDETLPLLTDRWQRRLTKTRLRFRTEEWQPSLLIDRHADVVRTRDQAVLSVHSINAKRLELQLEQVTADGIKETRHRIHVPDYQADAWQQWQLDLAPYLDRRGGLLRGLIKTSSGTLLKGFRINYQPDQLLVRRLDDRLMVWAVDGQNKAPLPGANLILRNGWDTRTEYSRQQTDNNGFVELLLPNAGRDRADNDEHYDTWWLQLDHANETSIAPLGIDKWDKGDRAADKERNTYLDVPVGDKLLWGITDKHLYSPGEALQYSFFVRRKQEQQFECVADKAGYHLAVFNSEEEILLRQGPLQLDDRCTASGNLTLPTNLSHGLYHVIVRDHPVTADDFEDGSYSEKPFHGRFLFEIANPRPPTINVTASADQSPWKTWSKPLRITTTASYFSGGPQLGAELSFSGGFTYDESYYGESSDPREQQHPGFRFELFDTEDRLEALEAELETNQTAFADANGNMHTEVATKVWLPGYSRFGGEVTSVGADKQKYEGWLNDLPVFHNSEFVGLKLNRRYPKVGEQLETGLLVLDTDNRAVIGKAITLTLYQHDRPSGGYVSDAQRYKRGNAKAQCQAVSAAQPVDCVIKAEQAGSYELVAAIQDSVGRRHEASIWLRISEPGAWRWFDDDEPELLLRADRVQYRVGDTAQIELQQPFAAGRALVQVERNRTLTSFWLDITDSSQRFTLPITNDMQYGATVTVIFTASETESPASSITARLPLKVATPALVPISVSTDRTDYRPGDPVAVTVQLAQPGKRGVLLTAVDSALLKLMFDADSYFNPDNGEFLQSYRSWRIASSVSHRGWISEKNPRLDVEAIQPVIMLARAAPAPTASTRSDNFWGNDGDEEERIEVTGSRIKRTDLFGSATDETAVLPNYRNRQAEHWRARIRQQFRQNAYWLAQGETDANGQARLQFTLPDNLTGWTLMAVSYDADHEFGFAKTEFLASLPIEARSNGPEQAIAGDRIGISATVRNAESSKKQISAKLTAQADGLPVQTRQHQQTLTGFAELLLTTELDTKPDNKNDGTVRWLVQAQEAKAEDAVAGEVRLRTPTENKRIQRSLLLQPGAATALDFPRPKDAFDQQATISWQPLSLLTGVQETADYMQAYPHRCWEQRTSRLWSAILANKLLAGASTPAVVAEQQQLLADWLEQAASFQARNGGFAYWRGEDRHADLYLSLYTAQAFASFRALGWQDGTAVEQRLHDYLAKQRNRLHPPHASEKPSAITDLMLWATLKPANSDHLFNKLTAEQIDPLGNEELIWLLKAVLQSSPQAETIKPLREALLARGFARNGVVELKSPAGSHDWRWLGSNQRTQCLAASVLLQTAANDSERTDAYAWLRAAQLQRLSGGEFGNTQENAYCLQAVADFAAQEPKHTAPVRLQASVNGKALSLPTATAVSINTQAQNAIQLRSDQTQPQWLTLAIDYRADAKRNSQQQQGFALQRQYEVLRQNRWQALAQQTLSVGDWVRVTLTVNSEQFEPHVALTDALPGAWVAVDAEHDATVPVHTLGELKTSGEFYERQFHGGYARFYAESLYPGRHQIQYFAKVVSHGRYQALPAKIEALYDSSRFGSSHHEWVVVATPR